MSKKRRKQATCLNCSYAFAADNPNNFCPECGQENTDKNVSWLSLVGDFIGNYLSLDSKLFRTIPRLLFYPGFLTNAFNIGKRIDYLTPIRIYLFMSVLYFSFFAAQFNNEDTVNTETISSSRIDSILSVPTKTLDSLTTPKDKELVDLDWTFGEESDTLTIHNRDVKRVILLSKKHGIEATIDTLRAEESLFTQNIFFAKGTEQLLKIYHRGYEEMQSYFFARLPLMMLFTIPIFAFIFKLLYIRRKRNYIEHIIFLLHFHAFLYVVLTFLLWSNDFLSGVYASLLMLGIFVYFLIAIKRVYGQSWGKSFLKGILFNLFYPICLSLAVVVTGIAAFLLF
ncbi:MAG: DUF3667 domain-containing protein [Chitinophagales bacterium]